MRERQPKETSKILGGYWRIDIYFKHYSSGVQTTSGGHT